MACSIEEQKAIKEAARKEYSRLKDLLDQGYTEDVENNIPDIEAAMENMSAIVNSRPQEIKDVGESIDQSTVLELNLNNPRVAGKPVDVVSGVRYENGKVTYKVKYPGRDKEYTVPAARVTADQVDPTMLGRYGSEPDVSVQISEKHERLKSRVWEDQTAALDLFDELADMDDTIDAWHKQDLRELLEKITDPQAKIMNEFKVYLNRTAEKNGGAAVMHKYKADELILDVKQGRSGYGMSAAEAYVHEMVHLSVEYARQFNKGPLASVITDLHDLYRQAAKEIKITDLVENGNRIEAARLWDYMFNSDNGLSEFIAYGLTNKKVKEKLATIDVKAPKAQAETVLSKMIAGVLKIWDTFRHMLTKHPKEMMADERLSRLVADMWEHNNTAIDEATTMAKMKAYGEKAREAVDSKIVEMGSKAVDILASGLDKAQELAGDTVVGDALKVGRTTARMLSPFTDEKHTAAIAQAARELEKQMEKGDVGKWFTGFFLSQEGTVQKVFNYLKKDDTDITRVEKLGLISQNIDRHRENIIARIGRELLDSMKGIDGKGQTALTDILVDLDMRVLFEKYKAEDIKKMLEDTTELDAIIEKESNKLRGMIKAESLYNYYKSQTMGLGHYLATHISGSTVNRNARHIADMKGTGHEVLAAQDPIANKNRKEIVKTIDRLATLEGMKKANRANKLRVAKMIDTHPKAIEKVTAYHNIHAVLNAAYKRENEIYVPTVKGEIKDLKAGWVEYMIAPSSEEGRATMKKRGYRYKGESAVKGMGMYTTMTSGMSRFEKGAAAKINPDKEMQNMVGATATVWEDKEDGIQSGENIVRETAVRAEKDIGRQLARVKMPLVDGMVPMYKGKRVINYGITAGKEDYASAVKQDRKVAVVLAKMIGEVQEKKEATEMNARVMLDILKDMDKNYRRGSEYGAVNRREYIEIGTDAKNSGIGAQEYADRLWKDMPHNIRMAIKKRPKEKRFIAVRRDMASMYFGRRAPSVMNLKVPFTDGKSIARMLSEHNMDYINEYVKLAADIWQEMIKILKVDVVIKTPKVLIDNIRSNLYLQSVLGQMPWDAVMEQIKMFKATKEYLSMERDKLALEVKIKSKTGTKADEAAYRRLNAMMKDSPVYDTMKAGLFTGVVDELNLEGLQSTTRGEELINKYTGWVPQIIKDGANMLYIGKDTWMFKGLMMVLQYSDFVMRTSRYHYLVAKGVDKGTAMKMITDEAVNYDRDLGGAFAWTKAMGPWWFFHYFFGANKNMAEKMRDRPSALLMMEAASMPSPMDAAPWNKQFGYTMYGPADLAFDKTTAYIQNPALLRAFGFAF